MPRPARIGVLALLVTLCCVDAFAQAPVAYRFSFADRVHRLMDVEATFPDLPAGPLRLRMSRTSPGRYALHEFAKNVFDVRVTDTSNRPLAVTRPNPHEWDVATHPGTVRVTYRVFGDRVDGTYLAVDSTHAHVNMPSAVMWARGLELRPITVRFEPPAGTTWRVATQLFPGSDAFTFTAPNLQYLIDSPSEFGAFSLKTFTVPDGARTPTFRLAVHHDGTDAELDAFVRDVEKIVREERNVFGEYAPYENNTYTFIADYLPWANGDGMEHRNSTIVTSRGSIRQNRSDLLDTIAHEFFHSWNVERIRPKTLEPFNLEEANMTGELWLAEGVTNYYGPLLQLRAGVTDLATFLDDIGGAINTVVNSPGRQVRTAEEMSRMAPFVDAAVSIDPTNNENTFISYYTWGSVIGIGLDLTLREQSNGKVTLDQVMRALWTRFGKPGGTRPGYVDRPYTPEDVKATLTEVSGDAMFADTFFAKYIQGHDVVDFSRLLARAGLLWQGTSGRAWAGNLRFADQGGRVRVAGAVPMGSPAYAAGLERDDVIVSVGGANVSRSSDVDAAIQSRKPGQPLDVVFERRGQRVNGTITLAEDPTRRIVPMEQAGQTLTPAQKQFRDAWLSSQRNTF